MKFILEHDAQGRITPGLPLVVDVTPERRADYPLACKCQWVFKLHPSARPELIERRLLLEQQADKDYAICFCLGRLAPESVVELLERPSVDKWRDHPSEHAIDCAARLAGPADCDCGLWEPQLTRPICFIDVETTGVDPVLDRIIEFAAVVLNPDGSRKKFCQRFNPGIPIPAEATEVHGITDADVAGCPPFSEWGARIARSLAGKDIGGYNVRRLDLPIIDEEMRRCGGKLDLTGVNIIDASVIFFKSEPRNLEASVKKYLGRDHSEAHGADADAEASLDVWLAQMNQYEELQELTLPQLSEYCVQGDNKPADIAGKLYWDKEGFLCYGFGKSKDVRVKDDEGFGQWMLDCRRPPFPASTCEVLRAEFARLDAPPLFVGSLEQAG